MKKTVLIICQHSPWQSIAAKETLDLALAGGAFDIAISLLFLDDGVFQLVKNQHSNTIQQKDLCANLQALPLFGIDKLLVAKHSLEERNLSSMDFILPVIELELHELSSLCQQYDVVITA